MATVIRFTAEEIHSANILLKDISKIIWEEKWIEHEQACVDGIDDIITTLKTPNKEEDRINLFCVSYINLMRISALLNNGKIPVYSSRSDNIEDFCIKKVKEIKRRMYG